MVSLKSLEVGSNLALRLVVETLADHSRVLLVPERRFSMTSVRSYCAITASAIGPTGAAVKFGEAGAVEATGLEGYYIYIAMIMNVARSPLNPGEKPALVPFPK